MDARFIRASTLKGIADAIRDKKGVRNPLSVSDFATEISSIEGGGDVPPFDGLIEIDGVPATDYTDYYEEGKNDGIAEGREAEWSDFWDDFQVNGTRTDYSRAFQNPSSGWTARNLRPKHDIICEGDAANTFYGWENKDNTIDLGAILKHLGRNLDTSKATNLTNFFAYGYGFIGELPTISCESAGGNTSTLFRGVLVSKIEKVIVTEQTIYTNWFMYCNNLTEIRFEGIIANSINLQYSPLLSADSLRNIMTHLSETTSGKTATFSQTAVNKAFETSVGANDGSTSEEWLALVNSRTNWTISLI